MGRLIVEQLPSGQIERLEESEWNDIFRIYRGFNGGTLQDAMQEEEFFKFIQDPHTQVGNRLLSGNHYSNPKLAIAHRDDAIVGFMLHADNVSGSRTEVLQKRIASKLSRLGLPMFPDKVYRTLLSRGVAINLEDQNDHRMIMQSMIGSIALHETHGAQTMTIFEHSGDEYSHDRDVISQCGFEQIGSTPGSVDIPSLIAYRATSQKVRQVLRPFGA